ncbi:MAG TPA: tetratricopeptide repeat protein [Elusimicrobiales bacterium]|nr:tetratricopeptide repeat protein [Elusimicrobiales bacterium]
MHSRVCCAALALVLLALVSVCHAAKPVKPQSAPNAPKKLSKVEEARLISCSNKAQNFYEKKQYVQAEAQFRDCLKIQPGDPNTLLSLAGVLMEEGKLEEAKSQFDAALPMIDQTPALAGYAYSRLGDICLKLYRPKEAGPYYKKALEMDPKDINAQVGLGKYYEGIGNWKDAAEAYRAGLKLDPINTVALKGLRRVEPRVMTDAEILEELKFRRVIPPIKNELDKDGRVWFQLIRQAENYDALEYLRTKLKKLPPPYYLKKTYPDGQFRMLLTWQGYSVYRNMINKEVIEYFNSKKVASKFIFKIKSHSGKPLFGPNGELTSEGLEVYFLALAGRKYYTLPWEDPPDSLLGSAKGSKKAAAPEPEPDTPEIAQARKDGHQELSSTEYEWLKKATDCSEDTFKNSFDMRIFRTDRGGVRYFIHTVDYPKNIPYSYIVDFRAGKRDASSSKGKGMFGVADTPEAKLCGSDGNLVDDDVDH